MHQVAKVLELQHQMKEHGKSPPDQTDEEELGSLPEKEFRVTIVKMIQSLGIKRNEVTEKHPEDEGTWLKPTGLNNGTVNRKSTRKIIQKNNSRDDPNFWK